MKNKYLGVDFGNKKIGLAFSDDRGSIAFPLKILENKKESIFTEFFNILKQKKISKIVFGESVGDSGKKNQIDNEAKLFARNLQEKYFTLYKENLEIFFEKEWYSTIEARKNKDIKNIDHSAAAIILQRFLERNNGKK